MHAALLTVSLLFGANFVFNKAILGVVHMAWQADGNLLEPLFYAAALALLLGLRAIWRNAERRRQLQSAAIPVGSGEFFATA